MDTGRWMKYSPPSFTEEQTEAQTLNTFLQMGIFSNTIKNANIGTVDVLPHSSATVRPSTGHCTKPGRALLSWEHALIK